ncbi:MAG: alpha-glucosidase family protein [Pseudomonadota bacterium]
MPDRVADADWWRGAIIYQIYPRSFQDSDGDGIGDLAGATRRLDHLAHLGVDAVWISPVFRSPMRDFGYDVADYCDIDPLFGSLEIFDAFVKRAHGLGLRVIIDLVFSHTSDQHPWFTESRQARDGPKADWYVWADANAAGEAPNNWQSVFGGKSWEWSPEREQFYLHNFLKEQPDLNLHNGAVQDALLDALRFWLDRGVDGVRLDVVNFYFHDAELRSNPILAERPAGAADSVNPYDWQDHLYDKNRPDTVAFLKRMRAVLDSYGGRTSIGEISDSQYGLSLQAAYTSGGDRLHMCYEFSLLSGHYPGAEGLHDLIAEYEGGIEDGWACWAHSNHDVDRVASRWSLGADQQRLHAGILLSLRGTACLYQGEELGLHQADVPFEALQDPFGRAFWPDFKGRDGCRTPMVWEAGAHNAGFSDGKPWLPLEGKHLPQAVDQQRGVSDSLYEHYRSMIAYRKARPALAHGQVELLPKHPSCLAFIRRSGSEEILCAFNLSSNTVEVRVPGEGWTVDTASPFGGTLGGQFGQIGAYDALFAIRKTSLR